MLIFVAIVFIRKTFADLVVPSIQIMNPWLHYSISIPIFPSLSVILLYSNQKQKLSGCFSTLREETESKF